MSDTVTADGTALYRVRGENALLLYIGISDNFGRRWKEHAKRQPWWSEMRSLSVDRWYGSRAEAEAAEAAAIKAEQPKYNKTHAAPMRRQRVTVNPYPILVQAVAQREKPHLEYCETCTIGAHLVGGSGGRELSKRWTGGVGGTC